MVGNQGGTAGAQAYQRPPCGRRFLPSYLSHIRQLALLMCLILSASTLWWHGLDHNHTGDNNLGAPSPLSQDSDSC